ncbi:gamma-interferon-inducible lysosomal thiol reductase-like protein [Leptinotarsa decemlineata]|uniref:gamma-interferon-inducible lysosomal thiol reductase-like protein n=1 Tax=Leptinotarsa decemlineata TaxID=7539 RepID=UPI003D308501
MKWWFVSLLSALLVFENHAKNLTVSVYYECLCPHSVDFFKDQLSPGYKVLKDKVKVDLIPFGKANITKEGDKYIFTCQHQEAECYGNKVHACALNLALGDYGIKFAMCAMASPDATDDKYLTKCAANNSISWDEIQKCMESGKGDQLLVDYGNRTHSLKPKLTGVPTVTFDNEYIETLNRISKNNLVDIVDFLLVDSQCKPKNAALGLHSTTLLFMFSLILVMKAL